MVVLGLSPSDRWYTSLFSLGLGLVLSGFAQYTTYPALANLYYDGWDPHYFRMFSTLLDPNYLSILIVLSLLLLPLMYRLLHPRIVHAAVVFHLIALFLTYSRSGLIAILAGAVTLAATHKNIRGMLKTGLLTLVLVVTLIVLLPERSGEGVKLDRITSSQARIENWQYSIALIREKPILGHGFNTLRWVQRDMHVETEGIPSRAGAGVDSSLLFIGITTGVVGLVALGYFVYTLGFLVQETVTREYGTQVGKVLGASIVALGVHSLFLNSMFYPWVMAWMWILVGLVERKQREINSRT